MKPLKSLLITITRPRFIITLIILTLLAALIGVMVPQLSDRSPSYFEEWKIKSPITFYIVNTLQLNRVYTSLWFLILISLVMITLGYSVYLQVKRNLKHKGSQFTAYSSHFIEDRIKTVFKRRGYRLSSVYSPQLMGEQSAVNGERGLLFTKNPIGRWGSVIFHSGIFLIIASALMIFSLQKRGFFQLIEGDLFSGQDADFLVKDMGVFAGAFNAGFKTHLSRFYHTYWDTGEVKSIESSIIIIKDNRMVDHLLSVNNPLSIDGIKIYQSFNYGYSLSLILRKATGEQIQTHFLLDRQKKIGRPAIGKSDFPKTDYIFRMKFIPDITRPSFYPTKPILHLTVFEKGDAVFAGLLIPGQSIKIKDDILLFSDINNWSGLIFVKNPGMFIVYLGFVMGIAGITVMYLLPYKEIRLTMDDISGTLKQVQGTTKRYHASFKEELDEIRGGLGMRSDG